MTENQKNKKIRIKFLENEIERHRYLYYNEQPEISDAKYDAFEDELRELDPNNPVLFKIGVDDSQLFAKREHIIPMTSQDKVTTPSTLLKWAKDKTFKVFIVQFKLDGISIELQYKKGAFQYAVTRGNGVIGDDVSANVINMRGFVPKLNIPFTGAVRGEILMFFDTFNKKYPNMQNCRNAAAGIVRRKDGVGSSDLNLLFYDAISLDETVVFEKEIEKIKWLKSQGFNTVKSKTVKSAQEVVDVRKRVMDTTRSQLDYDIDGLVVKGNIIDLEDMK